MATFSARELTLRRALLATFLPALGFLVASGIVIQSNSYSYGYRRGYYYYYGRDPPCAFFALIPVGLSVISSAAVLFINRKRSALRLGGDEEPKSKVFRKIMLYTDVVLSAAYIAVLVLMWVLDLRRVAQQGREALVLAYATVPVTINWLIHLYFATVGLIELWRTHFGSSFTVAASGCPNCQHCRQREAARATADKPEVKEGYSLLRAEEYDEDHAESSTSPRVSVEV